MHKVRNQKNNNLPDRRPIWLPHYFWHWLHHFPHFHQMHLGNRVPWIASSARLSRENDEKKGDDEDISNAYSELDDGYYYEYESEEGDEYNNELMDVSNDFANAYIEYSDALDALDDEYSDYNYVDEASDETDGALQ